MFVLVLSSSSPGLSSSVPKDNGSEDGVLSCFTSESDL